MIWTVIFLNILTNENTNSTYFLKQTNKYVFIVIVTHIYSSFKLCATLLSWAFQDMPIHNAHIKWLLNEPVALVMYVSGCSLCCFFWVCSCLLFMFFFPVMLVCFFCILVRARDILVEAPDGLHLPGSPWRDVVRGRVFVSEVRFTFLILYINYVQYTHVL